ncbi:MAG: hypothetical protein Q4D38_01380 [Planctomycetia bacterium]|nr:hypothetical protein [Planctomycetia bacterium]
MKKKLDKEGKEEILRKLQVRGHKNVRREILFDPVKWICFFLILCIVAAGGYLAFILYRQWEKPYRDQAKSVENMQMIMDAIERYRAENNGQYPLPYTIDSNGDPLLSWRVHILPYIQDKNGLPIYQDLYNQFDLKKSWLHSENSKLLSQMPDIFFSPMNDGLPLDGMCNYLTIRHKDSVFPGGTIIFSEGIEDPPKYTVAVVEVGAEDAVHWTEPRDFVFNPEEAKEGAPDSPHGGKLVCGMCDGSVRVLDAPPDLRETLQNLPPEKRAEENPWTLPFLRNNGYIPPVGEIDNLPPEAPPKNTDPMEGSIYDNR